MPEINARQKLLLSLLQELAMSFTRLKYFFEIVLLFYITGSARAQPQWKFHIAFEDAVGARDTIWLIWDTTATGGVDVALGEGPVQLNYNVFNVFIGNTNSDTTKTSALSYNYYPMNSALVYAINYQYPLMIRWDSSLFHATYLPPLGQNMVQVATIDNDYFFFVNNTSDHYFNMLLDNQVSAPSFNWFSQSQFPMYFTLTYDTITGMPDTEENLIRIYPNPVDDQIIVRSLEFGESEIELVEIYDILGQSVFIRQPASENRNLTLDVSTLNSGIYFLKLKGEKEERVTKFVKE